MSLTIPISSSQAASVLHFSATELHSIGITEEAKYFVKGTQYSNAKLKSEAAHICLGDYVSPTLYIQGVSGGLGHYKLKSSYSASGAKWIVNPNGKNEYVISINCKQWSDFAIPASEGYKFTFQFKQGNEKIKDLSPWYSRKYLSDNQFKVHDFFGFSIGKTVLSDKEKLYPSSWRPITELPDMPTIRVLNISYGANDVDQQLPKLLLEISDEQNSSTLKFGWNTWAIEFNDGIDTSFSPYTYNPTFIWPHYCCVSLDQIFSKSFEVRVLQAGYRYSSKVGKFTIPPGLGNVHLTDVHRTIEGAPIGDFG